MRAARHSPLHFPLAAPPALTHRVAQVNQHDSFGLSPLHEACRYGHTALATYLVRSAGSRGAGSRDTLNTPRARRSPPRRTRVRQTSRACGRCISPPEVRARSRELRTLARTFARRRGLFRRSPRRAMRAPGGFDECVRLLLAQGAQVGRPAIPARPHACTHAHATVVGGRSRCPRPHRTALGGHEPPPGRRYRSRRRSAQRPRAHNAADRRRPQSTCLLALAPASP